MTVVQRSSRRFSSKRIEETARGLLEASALCALATVSREGRAYVNTMYFAWDRELRVVWISAPEAQHSRNLRQNRSAAITVFDSGQKWGGKDRGIQLFGSASELGQGRDRAAQETYSARFPAYDPAELGVYGFYRFRPSRIKLFDEEALGPGVFVTASVKGRGRLEWTRTEVYRSGSRRPG
ncbi:MAG TPA: pyridoxamine 5'-phosphate oxidase family protein [Gaiellaceae bacterium]